MIRFIKHPRNAVVAAAAALLGGATLFAILVAPVSAETHSCPSGEFCLYFNEDANGGFYHFAGSDSNLNNDHYEGGDTGEVVGDTSRYALNFGIPGAKDDVIVYGLPGYKGARDCVEQDFTATLPRRWWNNIESYRWVTDAECRAAGQIDAPSGGTSGGHPIP